MTRGRSQERGIWRKMIARCRPDGDARYGGRGIRVCDRWANSFEAFYADMGPRPSPGHTLDRENNDGDYEPGNCRWATRAEQDRNKSTNVKLSANGDEAIIADWARRLGISRTAVTMRIKAGWSPHEAATAPPGYARGERHGKTKLTADDVREIRRRKEAGEKQRDIGREFGVSESTVSSIIRGRVWGHVK